MAIPVLIAGRSGTGKSASLRNCVNNEKWNLVNVIDKPLPFRGKILKVSTDDYPSVMKSMVASKADSIVIDDAGYLITNQFMRNHAKHNAGNAVFSLYNQMADNFWNLIEFIKKSLPADKIVYIFMHEDIDEYGNVKPKTIGKLLDDKICLEGMFTIMLRCTIQDGKHVFLTNSEGVSAAKSPMGMFEEMVIDNDIAFVDKTIREYYKEDEE